MATFSNFISIVSENATPELIEILKALENVDLLISKFEAPEQIIGHLRHDLADLATTVYYNLDPNENA